MEKIDWSAKVKEALERTDIMALSSVGEDGSWTSPVHYEHNSKLELSFQSMMDTKHVANILKDPRVSVAIYRPEPFPDGGNLGLQIKGIAKQADEKDTSEGWHTFTVIPQEVWCFDSRVSRERKKVDLADLKL